MTVGDYIKDLRVSRGYSQEQLGKLVGVQRAAVQKWECGAVQNLKRETMKRLSEVFNVPASSFVDDEQPLSKGVLIPVLGYVRAGVPIEAVEEILDYEEISQEQARTGEFFALKIKGDSMEPKISEGDVVIVRKQSTVENGELAVVLVNGDDATVKKFYRSNNGVKLVSTNPKYDPFFYTPTEVDSFPISVIGRVVELRAKF